MLLEAFVRNYENNDNMRITSLDYTIANLILEIIVKK